jgi:predicted aminopeptidase
VEETADMERTVIALSRLDEDARQKPASIWGGNSNYSMWFHDVINKIND